MSIKKKYIFRGIITSSMFGLLIVFAGIAGMMAFLFWPRDGSDAGTFDGTVTVPEGIHVVSESNGKTFVSEKGGLNVQVKLGSETVSSNQNEAYMQISLSAEDFETEGKEALLDLVIVVDRSGSMFGDKIMYVKEALQSLKNYLDREDRIVIITYDTEVSLAYEGYFEADSYTNTINNIDTGDSTNLAGGLRMGLEKISESGEHYHKLILLSDGLANVGESTPEGLAAIVEANSGSTIVSTIGVGADYDENIMTAIAKTGRGSYYFLENPKDAERIFAQELEKSLNIVAEDIDVKLNMDSSVDSLRGVGYELTGTSAFSPLDMYAQKESVFLFEVKTSDITKYVGQEYRLGEIQISFKSRKTNKIETISIPVAAKVTDKEINPLAADDMYREFMINVYADKLWQVDQYLNDRKNEDARSLLDTVLEEMNVANTRLEGQFEQEVKSIEEKQEFLGNLGDVYINESEEGRAFKKENQNESYQQLYDK